MRPTALLLCIGIISPQAASADLKPRLKSFRRLTLTSGQRDMIKDTVKSIPKDGMRGVERVGKKLTAVMRPGTIKAGSTVANAVLESLNAVGSQYKKDQARFPFRLIRNLKSVVDPVTQEGVRMDGTTKKQLETTLGNAASVVAADIGTLMKATKGMIELGTLSTSRQLSWTRKVAARTSSDWGLLGVKPVYKEKELAVQNLDQAEQNLRALKNYASSFSWLGQVSGKSGLKGIERKVDKMMEQLTSARSELRSATKRIWSDQWIVFAKHATKDQMSQLEAMFQK